MSQPRVLMLTDSPVFAGTERHMLELARALQSLDVRVLIACPVAGILSERAKEFGIDVVVAPAKGYFLRMLWLLWKLLRSGEIDLIHAHNGVSHVLSAAAVALAGKGRCVATHHFLMPKRAQRKGIHAFVSDIVHGWTGRRTDALIAVSNAVATSCRNFSHDVDICVIHNGIFAEAVVQRSWQQVRTSLSVSESAPLIVSVARLDPEKTLGTLIEAMRTVVAEHPDATCIIAGEGKEREHLERMIQNCGVAKNVRLIGFDSDAISLINAADLFVLPSVCEPFGLVILEAMSLSKPVIAARAGGPVEMIEHDKTGHLFPPLDSQALARAIKSFLGHRASFSAMADAGRELVSARFSAVSMARQTLLLYQRTFAPGTGRRQDRSVRLLDSASGCVSPVKLTDFWLLKKKRGLRNDFYKLRPLNKLSPAEQLLFAVLRKDTDICLGLLVRDNGIDEGCLTQFLDIVERARLANLVLSNVIEMQLVALFNQSHQFLSRLSQEAATEAASQQLIGRQFKEMLALLADFSDQIAWVKGLALSRTLYDRPEYRNFSDFDLLIHPEAVPRVVTRLTCAGFEPFEAPEFCTQFGIAPMGSASQLLLAPSAQWCPVAPLTLSRGTFPFVDIRFDPLDRGLKMIETDRFWLERQVESHDGFRYRVPGLIDHLLICLKNLEKDRFANWRCLYDINLMVLKLGNDQISWNELIRRCQVEHLETESWAGLWLVAERLHAPVPSLVLNRLSPGRGMLARCSTFTKNVSYQWNLSSLFTLVVEALRSTDRRRKIKVLRESLVPNRTFLCQYYNNGNNGRSLSAFSYFSTLMLHWLTLALPAAVVRRSYGRWLWNYKNGLLQDQELDTVDQKRTLTQV